MVAVEIRVPSRGMRQTDVHMGREAMGKWIDADALTKEIKQDIADNGLTERYVFYRINDAPSIDIVRCKECRWGKPYSEKQLECDALGLGGLKFPDDFCSYGQKGDENVETD